MAECSICFCQFGKQAGLSMKMLIYYLATLSAFYVAGRVGEIHVRALKSAGFWHFHCTQVAFSGHEECLCLVLACLPLVSVFLLSTKSRHALPDVRFKTLKVRVGAAVEHTQAFRSGLDIFSVRMYCHRSWEHLHGIHFLAHSGLNQTLYFTTETAESSETSGSKVQRWQQNCPY